VQVILALSRIRSQIIGMIFHTLDLTEGGLLSPYQTFNKSMIKKKVLLRKVNPYKFIPKSI